MRFIGGKARIAKDIAPLILKSNPQVVTEPFCGALNVSVAMLKLNPDLKILASDLHVDLIEMWKAAQDGWVPPKTLTKEEYEALKNSTQSPLRTFAGYGCSFSGRWWGGYASDSSGRNYCGNAANSIEKIKPFLKNITFSSHPYQDSETGDVVYCDPPYANTTKPGQKLDFNSELFWNWVQNQKVPVFVSEYSSPLPFVWEKKVKTDMHTKNGQEERTENYSSIRPPKVTTYKKRKDSPYAK